MNRPPILVNIARALYSDSDIIVLDDPLAAGMVLFFSSHSTCLTLFTILVDAHVGKALFKDAILEASVRRGKTVILVTHALHFLPEVDYIYTLLDGQIQEQGTYPDLLNAGGVFSILVRDFGTAGESEKTFDQSAADEILQEAQPIKNVEKSRVDRREAAKGTGKIQGHLIRAEERKKGAISGAGMVFDSYQFA